MILVLYKFILSKMESYCCMTIVINGHDYEIKVDKNYKKIDDTIGEMIINYPKVSKHDCSLMITNNNYELRIIAKTTNYYHCTIDNVTMSIIMMSTKMNTNNLKLMVNYSTKMHVQY